MIAATCELTPLSHKTIKHDSNFLKKSDLDWALKAGNWPNACGALLVRDYVAEDGSYLNPPSIEAKTYPTICPIFASLL